MLFRQDYGIESRYPAEKVGFQPYQLCFAIDRPISAKRHLKKKGSSEGKGFAGLPFPGFLEGIGR